jgi:hypothetical protein
VNFLRTSCKFLELFREVSFDYWLRQFGNLIVN